MHFFRFLARPLAVPRSESDTAGGYVNCWIEAANRESAESRARQIIQENGWRVCAFEEHRVVGDKDYDAETPGREYYEQARIDGEVLMFHTWPLLGEES
jgi:hypothetical protein